MHLFLTHTHMCFAFLRTDLIAAFHDADIDKRGYLKIDDIRRVMHEMAPNFPMSEIVALMKFVDVDRDGQVSFEEYISLFRQFEEEKEDAVNK